MGVNLPSKILPPLFHSRKGQVIGAVMVFHDVSEAKAMALKMTHLAQHDLLTGLPNRLLLDDRITQAISLSHRQSKDLAVLFLDLDGFKQAMIRWDMRLATNCFGWLRNARLLACVILTL